MNKSELRDIGRDISLAFKELFSPMGVAFLVSSNQTELEELYGESPKKYGEFITVGYAKPDFNPKSNDFTEIYGYDDSVRGSLVISRYDLVKHNINLDLDNLRKTKVKYLGVTYTVKQVIPTAPLGDQFILYSFLVGDVDV